MIDKYWKRFCVIFMNLFGTQDDIDWLNMHNNMISKGEKNESK